MKLEINIIRRLPDFTIDVSFCCAAGTMQIISGPSGSGKTTIMRILAGLERSDHGFIRFNGTVWEDTAKRIFVPPQERGIGYVFQEYSLFPHLTVEQNIGFASVASENIGRYLNYFNIRHLADRYPRQLSGGERQRVALAQALAREPKVLLLDEPFSALDYLTRMKLRKSLQELKKSVSIPIIHVTHDLDEGLQMADGFLPLERGSISYDWLPENIRADLPGNHYHVCSGIPGKKPAALPASRRISFVSRLFGYLRACST